MKKVLHIGTFLGALTAAPLFAAEHEPNPFVPLDQIVEGGAELSVVALRCAGLFHSVWDYAGEALLGVEASQQAKDNAALFLEAGTQLRMTETGGAQADVSQLAVAEAFAASTLYFRRYEKNVAAGSDAYSSDELWAADLQICRNLAAQI